MRIGFLVLFDLLFAANAVHVRQSNAQAVLVMTIAVQSSWNQKLHCNDILYVMMLLDLFMTNRIIQPSFATRFELTSSKLHARNLDETKLLCCARLARKEMNNDIINADKNYANEGE